MSTSGWVAHASREPSGTLVTALRTWIDDSVRMTSATPGTCPVLADPLYAAIVGHMDRALHKRRQRPTFLSAHACGLMPTTGHGLRPMSELLGADEYGPEDLRVEHTQGASTLAEALARATSAERSALVPLFTEAEFMDSDMFHLHTSRLLEPRFSGVVIPFMIVPAGHSEDDGEYREDVVRAAGYTSYLFECDPDRLTADDHSRLAMLMEDVLDEVVQIKADAEAHVMSMPPLWPMVEIRSTADV
jgi:hypothetical protein